MATMTTTKDITKEEARLLCDTRHDFFDYGKTDVKCPRCGSPIVVKNYEDSSTIGCKRECVVVAFGGLRTQTKMTMEEVDLLHNTHDDFRERDKTDVKCPRCGGTILLNRGRSSYEIACEHYCIWSAYRGI